MSDDPITLPAQGLVDAQGRPFDAQAGSIGYYDPSRLTWADIPVGPEGVVCRTVFGTRKHGPWGFLCRLLGHPKSAWLDASNTAMPGWAGISCSRCGRLSMSSDGPARRSFP